MVYWAAKCLATTIVRTFFSEITIMGLHRIPMQGPVIFVVNHNNQFVDACMLMAIAPRKVRFLIAEVSLTVPIVGRFSKLAGAIPVRRPQDMVYTGMGKILGLKFYLAARFVVVGNPPPSEWDDINVLGDWIDFTGVVPDSNSAALDNPVTLVVADASARFKIDVKKHDKIRLSGGMIGLVKSVLDDRHLLVETMPTDEQAAAFQSPSTYQVEPKVNQSDTYESVIRALYEGETLGFFPEGGSHDRPELLPLKPGVALMALTAAAMGVEDILIIPVGIHYFQPDRFGSRCSVEIGMPLPLAPELTEQFRVGAKKESVGLLMEQVKDRLSDCMVSAKSYDAIRVIQLCASLYVPERLMVGREIEVLLYHSFARIFRILEGDPDDSPAHEHDHEHEHEDGAAGGGASSGKAPAAPEKAATAAVEGAAAAAAEAAAAAAAQAAGMPVPCTRPLRDTLEGYLEHLSTHGIVDSEVVWLFKQTAEEALLQATTKSLWLLWYSIIGLFPILLWAPMRMLASFLAEKYRRSALRKSKVKIRGTDVLASHKIIALLIMIPICNLILGKILVEVLLPKSTGDTGGGFLSGSRHVKTVLTLTVSFVLAVVYYYSMIAFSKIVPTIKHIVSLFKVVLGEINPWYETPRELAAERIDAQIRLRCFIRQLKVAAEMCLENRDVPPPGTSRDPSHHGMTTSLNRELSHRDIARELSHRDIASLTRDTSLTRDATARDMTKEVKDLTSSQMASNTSTGSNVDFYEPFNIVLPSASKALKVLRIIEDLERCVLPTVLDADTRRIQRLKKSATIGPLIARTVIESREEIL